MKRRRKIIIDDEESPDFIDMFADNDCSKCLFDLITDDLLATEILSRVLDSRTAVRCTAVCRRWRSLISAPEFVPNFKSRRTTPPPYSVLINFKFVCPGSINYFFSPLSIAVTGPKAFAAVVRHETHCLKSTCDEFLLFASEDGRGGEDLCLVSSLTGEILDIPKDARGDKLGPRIALVSHPNYDHTRFKFRIVNIKPDEDDDDDDDDRYYSTVFSSETGQWSKRALAPGMSPNADVVATGGLLFWLHYDHNIFEKQLVIFDAFQEWWAYVPLPVDLRHDLPVDPPRRAFVPFNEVIQFESSKQRLHIGAVRGRLRLAQLYRAGGVEFVLKIWELNYDDGNDEPWRLISQLTLGPAPQQVDWIYFFSFDEEDSDAIFVCCDRDVYRYSMEKGGGYEKILQLYRRYDVGESFNKWLPRFAHAVVVRRPYWHTALPKLPGWRA